MSRRMTPGARSAEILAAALLVAERVGWGAMTRSEIAAQAHCSEGLVTCRLGEMRKVRDLVMAEAVRQGCARVVLQGLAVAHPAALRAPQAIKREAMACAG